MSNSRQLNTIRGQVLLLTLLLLAVMAMALAGVSRASLARTLVANDAIVRLQRHWASISCQATLLPRAQVILNRAEKSNSEPVVNARLNVTLNDQSYQLVFVDEQGKVNVNQLLDRHGRHKADGLIKDLVRAAGSDVKIEFDPLPETGSRESPSYLPLVGSYAQVFPDVTPSELIGTLELPGAIHDITCWGDGKLNILRASESAIKMVCSGKLSLPQIDKLLKIRDKASDVDLSEMLEQLALTSKQTEGLEGLLTDTSKCHSLWMSAQDDVRGYHWLVVTQVDDQGQAGVYKFDW